MQEPALFNGTPAVNPESTIDRPDADGDFEDARMNPDGCQTRL